MGEIDERCISQECLETTGFSYTFSLINGKYKMTILYTLMEFSIVRFNEMKKYIGEISYKTLSSTLKELEADQLEVEDKLPDIPPHHCHCRRILINSRREDAYSEKMMQARTMTAPSRQTAA